MSALIAFCTCPDRSHAESLARALVERRLAACVSLLPGVHSVYRWQGQVHDKTEGRVALRTRRSLLPRIVDRAEREHP